jgi:general secretion pathway protein A
MYYAFFGLQETPFSITPDPRFLFLSQSHQEALGHLLYGIEERKGFITITGEVGTGKTLLCRALLNRLGRHVRTALIFNSFMSELDLLRSINEDFGIPPSGATRKDLIDSLNHYLIDEFSAGRNAVLIIDEAQNLAPPVLEQIRMLSNLETERGKLLQIILVGQPELRQQLARPDLRQLNQRVALRYHIQPFNRQETEDYINHRLVVAGSHGIVKFSRRALSAIFQVSQGIPRTINLLSDRAMLAAYVQSSGRIERKHIQQAWRELAGRDQGRTSPSTSVAARQGLLVAQGLVLGLAVILSGVAWFGMSRPKPPEGPVATSGLSADASVPTATATQGERLLPGEAGPDNTPAVAARQEENQTNSQGSEPANNGMIDGASATAVVSDPPPTVISDVVTPPMASFPGEVLLRALLTEYSRELQQRGTSARSTLVNVASSFGLEMLTLRIDLKHLKQFRVACLAETYDSHSPEPQFHVVRGSAADGLELTDAAGEIQRIADAEFTQRWSGQVYLFHRRGLELRGILAPGRQHPQVWSLQQRLGDLGYLQMQPSGVFDEATTEAVRRFQRDHSLQVDGTAGPATKIVLYHLVGRSLAEARQE